MLVWDVVADYHGTAKSVVEDAYPRTRLEAEKLAAHIHYLVGVVEPVVVLASRDEAYAWASSSTNVKGLAIFPFDWDVECW